MADCLLLPPTKVVEPSNLGQLCGQGSSFKVLAIRRGIKSDTSAFLSREWRGDGIFSMSLSKFPSDHLDLTWLPAHPVFPVTEPMALCCLDSREPEKREGGPGGRINQYKGAVLRVLLQTVERDSTGLPEEDVEFLPCNIILASVCWALRGFAFPNAHLVTTTALGGGFKYSPPPVLQMTKLRL